MSNSRKIKHRRTIHAGNLLNALYFRKPYKILPNSTLNQWLEVNADIHHVAGTYPYMGFFTIGNKGMQAVTSGDGAIKFLPQDQFPHHSNLYGPLPFVLRETDNDLTPAERANYALRVMVEFHGVTYIAYYAKRLELSDVEPQVQLIRKVDGVEDPIPYVPAAENLTPEPLRIGDGATPASADALKASSPVSITFTERDVQELINVCSIIHHDPDLAMVTEIGLCTGADHPTKLEDGNDFLEAIDVQVNGMLAAGNIFSLSPGGFTTSVDLGVSEPLTI